MSIGPSARRAAGRGHTRGCGYPVCSWTARCAPASSLWFCPAGWPDGRASGPEAAAQGISFSYAPWSTMSYKFFQFLINQMVAYLAFRPVALGALEIQVVELPVGLAHHLGGGWVHQRQDGVGRHVVDDIALARGVGGVDHSADIA